MISHILIIAYIYIKIDLLQKMNTATTIAIVAIMAALAFVAAGNFAIMKPFAQRNPTRKHHYVPSSAIFLKCRKVPAALVTSTNNSDRG
jgi:hypothetical protein